MWFNCVESLDEIKRPCKVDDFEAYAKKKHKNSDQIFQEEYEVRCMLMN